MVSIFASALSALLLLSGCGTLTTIPLGNMPASVVSAPEDTLEPDSSAQTVSSPLQQSSPAVSSEHERESSENVLSAPEEESSENVLSEPEEKSSENVLSAPEEESSETVRSESEEESSLVMPSEPLHEPAPETSEPEKVVDLTDISMNITSIDLPVGRRYRLSCHLSPDDATNTDFVWYVNGTEYIRLDPDGTITGLAIGKAVITAETYNGLTAVCKINVVESLYTPDPEQMVDESWFDNAVFVGDSLTNCLTIYTEKYGGLGNAEFVPAAGIGYHSALWDLDTEGNVHPVYYGKKY